MKSLEYVCFTVDNGYSVAARNYILALKDTFDIRIVPLDFTNSIKTVGEDASFFQSLEKKPEDRDSIQVFHCIPPMQKRRKNIFRKTIGFATFETTDPPQHWIHILNKNKAVIVPSKFNEEVFKKAGVNVPIIYVPHCVDPRYNQDVIPLHNYNEKFIFMYLGAWKRRKGYETLIQSYFEEFTPKDNVILFIHTDKTAQAEKYVREMKIKHKGTATVIIGKNGLSDSEIPGLMKSANCLVSPTKGEGFGLPALQSMALGIPVIITDYSGCKDYANDETAYLLRPEGFVRESTMDNIPQFSGKEWAYVSVSQLKKTMRKVLLSPEESRAKAEFARGYVCNKFSQKEIAKMFVEGIENLPVF